MPRYPVPPYKVKFTVTADQLGQIIPWGVTYLGVTALQQKTRGEGCTVAVLDTGINQSHPDFMGAIDAARDFTDSPSGVEDQNGHGSHTAGTIAARDNGQGVIGIAPECKLLIGKVLGDDGGGDTNMIIEALAWAKAQGAHIISMSLGSPNDDPGLHAALKDVTDAGLLVISAAGNDGAAGVGFPAAWDEVTVAVGAIDQRGMLAPFSSQGPAVDICAPGVHIPSCWKNGNNYAYLDGTSMATPHVSGVAALIYSYRKKLGMPQLSPQALFDHAIKATAKAAGPVPSPLYGYGVLNPAALLDYGTTAPAGQKLTVHAGEFLGYSWDLIGTPLAPKVQANPLGG